MLNSLIRSLFIVIFATSAMVALAAPVPTGKGKVTVDIGVPLEVFTYKPAGYTDGPLIVVFHGVNRNADEYRDFAITLAERFNAIVAAPFFDAKRFPAEAYQRGGVLRRGRSQPRAEWTYSAVPKIVADLRAAEGRELPFYVVGHSAGGQFVARGWEFNWRKVETPGIPHNAARMFAAPEAQEALFGRPARPANPE